MNNAIPAQTPALDSTEAAGLIQDLLQSVYRQAYLTVAEQVQLPMPPHTIDLLGNPDDFLQKIIPPDNPEAEAKRRREFGARVKALRKQAGLTQAEVAEKLGIVPQSVTNYESGKIEPSIRNLISLAAVLGTSTDYLLGRSVH